ncbi:HAD-IA family hydrolase [Piscinibacter sakaiensis]|uniref:HAD-IA family hydrolase n=1 Tax=Piscinibacter sakaiensis TaxID=1547922 RepID=UPI003727FDC5
MQALIWDVDGTLAETERDGHRLAFNEAFQALGLPWRWDERRYGELLAVTGGRERLLHDMATRPDAPADPDARRALAARLHALKNERYAAIVAAGGIPLRPGVAELLDEARRAGLPMAIATTTSRSNVEALLGAHLGPGWAAGFAAVVCAEDAPRKKPDPQAYLQALAGLGCAPAEALALEDAWPVRGARRPRKRRAPRRLTPPRCRSPRPRRSRRAPRASTARSGRRAAAARCRCG